MFLILVERLAYMLHLGSLANWARVHKAAVGASTFVLFAAAVTTILSYFGVSPR